MNLTSQLAKDLLDNQLNVWELAKSNYDALSKVESKSFSFDGFEIKVQFNPARIQSSAAKVDPKSIQERKCFLCPKNLPTVQKSVPCSIEYQVLVNPFPIFREHFTIPTYKHTDQLILDKYGDMLDLAKCMDNYTIFYNGPKCGASAPDHAHFQAGIKGFLPIEKEITQIAKDVIEESENIIVYAIRNYSRNSFLIKAKNKNASTDFFRKLYSMLELKDNDKEPMMNILAWYENETWYNCIIPREKHRPDCFFAQGDDNILISPASVDLSGVFITPLEKDFNKITAENIQNILNEICISEEKFEAIIDRIK